MKNSSSIASKLSEITDVSVKFNLRRNWTISKTLINLESWNRGLLFIPKRCKVRTITLRFISWLFLHQWALAIFLVNESFYPIFQIIILASWFKCAWDTTINFGNSALLWWLNSGSIRIQVGFNNLNLHTFHWVVICINIWHARLAVSSVFHIFLNFILKVFASLLSISELLSNILSVHFEALFLIRLCLRFSRIPAVVIQLTL